MIGKNLGNRYEIVEKIGGGGMAIVYKAKCTLLNRYVAVKILRPEFVADKDLLDKFRRESQAAASLSHPNIVNIYDVGEDEGIYYIVMEYVAGKTLKEIIKEKGHLSFNEIIDFGKQIAYALKHAHNNHIVHRDIKPHNILVTADGRAKVTDFGIAVAATSSTITNAGSVIGSVHYFSPEQARGGYTDEKSDLYSLGIVLYEMATGKVPFEGESPITVALKQIQEKPKEPSKIIEDLPSGLEEIILKLMQKEQSSRYQTAQDLIDDLNHLKNDPSTRVFGSRISETDSPTQVIPVISEDMYGKTVRDKAERVTHKSRRKEPPVKEKKLSKWLVTIAILLALMAAIGVTAFFYAGSWLKTDDVEVPPLVGKDIDEAKTIIEELELNIHITERFDSEVPVNHVRSQSPSAGMKVKKGQTINVSVSAGSRLVKVPNLINQNGFDAKLLLKEANLEEGEVTEDFSDLPIGVIIDQNPRAGLEIPENSEVNYVVSKGKELATILMPSLIGSTLESAEATLKPLGISIGTVSRENSEVEVGLIIEQSIQPQTETLENSEVDLVVSLGPEAGEEPQPQPGDGEGNDEDPQPGDDEDGEDDTNTGVPISTRPIYFKLDGYSGIVDIEIFQLTNNGRVRIETITRDISKDGRDVNLEVRSSGQQTFEIYVNGNLYDTIEITF
ncbi:Stk1 family PASTA domain-containing Ser/Thr kinase [Alkaliphilus serpentinus]|nr:Stk1 family PASTA domain-containing Ser/Thr kinase [Alkaliphilus serpentinus]